MPYDLGRFVRNTSYSAAHLALRVVRWEATLLGYPGAPAVAAVDRMDTSLSAAIRPDFPVVPSPTPTPPVPSPNGPTGPGGGGGLPPGFHRTGDGPFSVTPAPMWNGIPACPIGSGIPVWDPLDKTWYCVRGAVEFG